MTILSERPVAAASEPAPKPKKSLGSVAVSWITSTDHKVIGYMYLMLSTFWFVVAGAFALVMRAELAVPGLQIVSLEQYNQLFTMHGTIMLFLFATPLYVGYGNVIMPLQIGALSMSVWAHHLYVTGSVYLPYFSIMTMLIAVPTGVKFFNWIGTMWKGSVQFDTPMLWTMGFLVTFLFGGLTGIILSAPPLDFHVSDSYFVVAHFHYTVFGTVVFMFFAGLYYWWPKMTGKMLNETIGKWHFWTLFIGFQVTFLIQHWLGVEGMPRRYGDYLPADNFQTFNEISTAGTALLSISMLFFFWNVITTSKNAPKVTVDDPWGWSSSLEWATSCPPPRHNFVALPPIRSERPAFDLHYPELSDTPTHMEKPVSVGGGH